MKTLLFKTIIFSISLLFISDLSAQVVVGPRPSNRGEHTEARKEFNKIQDTDTVHWGAIDTITTPGACAQPGFWYKSLTDTCPDGSVKEKTEWYIFNETVMQDSQQVCITIQITLGEVHGCNTPLKLRQTGNTQGQLKLFPNPTSVGRNINLLLPTATSNNISIYDLTGKEVMNLGNINSNRLSINNNLPIGTYVIKIESVDGDGNVLIQSEKLTVTP